MNLFYRVKRMDHLKCLAAFAINFLLVISVMLTQTNAKTTNAVPNGHANDYLTKIVQQHELPALNDYLVDFTKLKGLVFIDTSHQLQRDTKNLSNHFSVTQPITVFPSPFPRELFNLAWEVQRLMARVHLRVSLDHEFLKEAMEGVAKAEKPGERFIGEMMDIMEAVVKGNNSRNQQHQYGSGMTLLMQRSDYMTHLEEHASPLGNGKKQARISLKQIEVSTGTHGGQGQNPHELHRQMLDKVRYMRQGVRKELPEWFQHLEMAREDTIRGQAMAVYETWLEFARIHGDRKAVILMISAPKRSDHSHFDERKWSLFKLEDIARERGQGCPRVVQMTIAELPKRLTLDEERKHLLLDGKRRVAIAFHSGYLPSHFAGKDDWRMRLQMEQSTAVMVPNVFTFLAGTKKVQQVLAEPGQLERFFPELKAAENPRASAKTRAESVKLQKGLDKLRETFIGQWGLGKFTEEETALIKEAIANSDDYVLKENLEGGKGNRFGQKLAEKLKELEQEENYPERSLYVLQKKIRAFTAKNAIMPVPPAPESGLRFVDVNSELSIFGALLAKTSINNASEMAKKHHHRQNRNDAENQDHKNTEQDKQPMEKKILFNTVDGYGVRTKITSNVMCNICGGNGGVDSLVLFPQENFLENNNNSKGKAQLDGLAGKA